MIAIVAVDRNWGIGKAGGMLFRLPGELRGFREKTLNQVVVMGRATLRSLPGGRPLTARENIVLSRDESLLVPGAKLVRGLEDLSAVLKLYPRKEVFLIGGQSLYEQLLDYCAVALVTKVDAQAEADRFFPNLDERPGWHLADCGAQQEEDGIRYRLCEYINDSVKRL